jgi:hypothetical protein
VLRYNECARAVFEKQVKAHCPECGKAFAPTAFVLHLKVHSNKNYNTYINTLTPSMHCKVFVRYLVVFMMLHQIARFSFFRK